MIATYEETLRNKILYSDGYEIETDTLEVVRSAKLVLMYDSKHTDESDDPQEWRIEKITAFKGYEHLNAIRGLPRLPFDDSKANEIQAFLNDVIAKGKNPEVTAFENAERLEQEKAEKESARATVEKAKTTIKHRSGRLLTGREADAYINRYNMMHNEGGEGYIPTIITQEMFDEAVKVLGCNDGKC